MLYGELGISFTRGRVVPIGCPLRGPKNAKLPEECHIFGALDLGWLPFANHQRLFSPQTHDPLLLGMVVAGQCSEIDIK